MDPVMIVGLALAAAGTVALVPRSVALLRARRLPVAELAVLVVLVLSVDVRDGDWPPWQVGAVFVGWGLLLLTYPDGRFRPGWSVWPWTAYGALVGVAVVAGTGFDEGSWAPVLVLAVVASGAAQVRRYQRRSSPVEREATQWLVLGFVVSVAALLAGELAGVTAAPDGVAASLLRLVGLVLPLSAVVGLLVPRRISLNRAVHVVAVVSVSAVVLAGLHRLTEPYLSSGGSAALLAVASPALVLTLSPFVCRVVYGRSGSEVRRVGDRLNRTVGPDDVVATVVSAVRDAVGAEEVVVGFGEAPPPDRAGASWESFPVSYQGRRVATLHVAPRPAEPELAPRDRRMLTRLADQAGAALHGAQVVRELRTARERLLEARADERRRIRRDLHDELGPTLAGLGMTASALVSRAGGASPTDPERALERDLERDLADGITEASALVRRIVYDLYPVELDERGLVGALEDRLRRRESDGAMVVRLEHGLVAGEELPAAVEVAALRIVQEAVTNARRHAGATECRVVVRRVGSTLHLTVADNGVGLRPDAPVGIGLRSISERAEELGGTSRVVGGVDGTTVAVTLPLTGVPG